MRNFNLPTKVKALNLEINKKLTELKKNLNINIQKDKMVLMILFVSIIYILNRYINIYILTCMWQIKILNENLKINVNSKVLIKAIIIIYK